MRALQQEAAERKRAHRAAAGAATAGRAANDLGAAVARAASGTDAAAGRPAAKRAREEPDEAEVGTLWRTGQRCVAGQGSVTSAATEPDLAEVAAAGRTAQRAAAVQGFRGDPAGVGGSPGSERRAVADQGLRDSAMRGSQSRGMGSSAREPAVLGQVEGLNPVRLHEERRGRAHEAGYANGAAYPVPGRALAADDGGGGAGTLPPGTGPTSV